MIAGILLCTRTDHFPVIAGRALAKPSRRPAVGHADEIEHAVRVQIDDREHIAAWCCRTERLQLVTAVGEPDPRLPTSRPHQIERTVVIEIGGDQAMASRRGAGKTIPSRDLARDPHLAGLRRNADHAHRVERDNVNRAIRIDVGNGHRHNIRWPCQIGNTSEHPVLTVDVDMQVAGRVDEDRIRICITIQIGPSERARVECAREWLLRLPRAIAVVPQHDRRTFANADDQIEVAIHLDVSRPGAHTVVGGKRPGVRTSGDVGERSVFVLQQ